MMEYILIGILQGILEWIPISSEGVIALASQYMIPGRNPVDMAIFLHLGTLLAVLIYFRREWAGIIALRDRKMLRFLAVATVVSLAVGYPLYVAVREVAAGAFILIVMGAGLMLTACFHGLRHASRMGIDHGSPRLAIFAGALQGLSVIPGLSRSGSTIFGLSMSRLGPGDILRISYLMSAPVILASSIFIVSGTPSMLEAWPALVSSLLAGLLSLSFLMKVSQRISFFWFAASFGMLSMLGGALAMLL